MRMSNWASIGGCRWQRIFIQFFVLGSKRCVLRRAVDLDRVRNCRSWSSKVVDFGSTVISKTFTQPSVIPRLHDEAGSTSWLVRSASARRAGFISWLSGHLNGVILQTFTKLLVERSSSARRALIEMPSSSSQLVERASSCKRGIRHGQIPDAWERLSTAAKTSHLSLTGRKR